MDESKLRDVYLLLNVLFTIDLMTTRSPTLDGALKKTSSTDTNNGWTRQSLLKIYEFYT